jgi:hypothetical protein
MTNYQGNQGRTIHYQQLKRRQPHQQQLHNGKRNQKTKGN